MSTVVERSATVITLAALTDRRSLMFGGAALLIAAGATGSARADDLCDQYSRMVVAEKYIVQNNRWNGSIPGRQCIKADEQVPGFTIKEQTGDAPTSGAPVSYPSIYVGCHYGNCSPDTNLPNTNLPIQIKSIKRAQTSITFKFVGDAIFDASYDIWLNPTAIKTGVNQQEVMIWLNRQGKIAPVGNKVAENVKIAGRDWQVWSGTNNVNDVITYVASSATPSMSFNVLDFVVDASRRAAITDDFYLTSIQAGFEPWQHGAGLTIEAFSVTVDPLSTTRR